MVQVCLVLLLVASVEAPSVGSGLKSQISRATVAFAALGLELNQPWTSLAPITHHTSQAYQERSPEAMFNLGFMHEFGAGVPKDLQLASRFYGMALHTHKEAALAVYCARAWLWLHKAWDWFVKPWLSAILPAYEHVWSGVLTLQPPYTSILGPWTAMAEGLMPSRAIMQLELGAARLLDTLGITAAATAVLDSGDLSETAMLLGAAVLLYVVLRMRRARAAAANQFVNMGENEEARRAALADQITQEGLRVVEERRRARAASQSGGGALGGAAASAAGSGEAANGVGVGAGGSGASGSAAGAETGAGGASASAGGNGPDSGQQGTSG